jgi:uncharacterized protein DUF3108
VIRRKSLLPLLLATLISLALHAMMLAGTWLQMPRESPEPTVLEARLAPAPAPPPAASKAPPPPAPKHKTVRAKKRPPKPNVLALRASPESATPALPVDIPAPVEEEEPAVEEASPPATPAEPAQPEVVATAPPTISAQETPPLRSLPRRGRITYTLFYGEQKFNIGRTVQSWEIDGDHYRLGSASETTGIVDVFRSERRAYMSQGKVTASGLRPDSFLMSRTRRGEVDEARAHFDWNGGELTWGAVNEKQQAQLPAGSQDFLSLMYQLSIRPPSPGRLRVPITTGTKFETYELDVLPEETIDTPLGALRALPVKQVPKLGKDTIQIWLAAEYRYLPVKVRFYNRYGEPAGEQVVSDIRVSDDMDANAPVR